MSGVPQVVAGLVQLLSVSAILDIVKLEMLLNAYVKVCMRILTSVAI